MKVIACLKQSDKSELEDFVDCYYRHRKRVDKKSDFICCGYDIGMARYDAEHPDYPLIDISHGVREKKIHLESGDVYVFTPAQLDPAAGCIFFIHGGSFISGGILRSRNVVRYLAAQSGSEVIFIDYGLAPEHDCSQIISQCLTTIYEMIDKRDELGLNLDKISILGESAGGNIALACSYLDAQQRKKIESQALIYPVVDMSPNCEAYWQLNQYGENLSPMVISCIESLRGADEKFRSLYLQNKLSVESPLVSPLYYENAAAFPRTFLATAEFDYLRIQGELFGARLQAAGVAVEIVRYKGVVHGFMDRIGYFWQAQSVIDETIKFLRQSGSK